MKQEHLLISGVTVLAVGIAAISFFLPNQKHFVIGAWTIAPPLWFWFQYTFLTTDKAKDDPIAFARLKYSQELAAKVWLAVTAVLILMYFDWALPPKR